MTFALDDRLARDTLVIGDLTLCRVLMMNDAAGLGSFSFRDARALSS